MRVLYYNWVDYLDDEGRGGGVRIYQRNLMAAMQEQPEADAVFLSSGLSYDLPARAPRWEKTRHGPPEDRVRRYEIVNSAVLAPAHHAFGDPTQLEDGATEAAFLDFIEQTGPYDIVHFNNLEGVPASVLSLVGRLPQTRVILSLHNYYPICAQVNLWQQERENCTDFAGGRRCETCLPHTHDPRLIRLANGLSYRMKCMGLRPGNWSYDFTFRWGMRLGRRLARLTRLTRKNTPQKPVLVGTSGPHPHALRRSRMVALINAHCDRVLCVSDAVGRLAAEYGISPDLLQTSYIGTSQADCFARTAPRVFPQADDGTITLAYLGYMRRDKGFFFLLEALEQLPRDLAGRIRLVVAARQSHETGVMARLRALSGPLCELHYHDGYSHDELDSLLADVDVGLVPVLWHDNLPQVAIEMHARHIPLLCADMGGAQELGRAPTMVFPAGDIAAFHARIAALLDGGVDMAAYWQGAMAPVNMPAHMQGLMAIYKTSPG